MSKTEQIRKEWEESEEAEYMESDTSIRIIGDWWLKKLAEQREEAVRDYKKSQAERLNVALKKGKKKWLKIWNKK